MQSLKSKVSGLSTEEIKDRINEAKVKTKHLNLQKEEQNSSKSIDPSELRIFVKNLRPETSSTSLHAYFSRWGHITDIFIRKSGIKNHQGPQCYMGYLTFSKYYHQSPLNILHIIDGQSCPIFKTTSKFNPNYEHVESSCTIMCSGPIHGISEADIRDFFGKFGTLCNIVRKRDSSNPGKFQRFAFIRYNEKNAVDKIMKENNHVIKGQTVDIRRVKDRL